MKKLVFCCSVGYNDNYLPKKPIVSNPDWDHICFTSCNNINKTKGWNVVKLKKPKGLSYAKFARHIKLTAAEEYWDKYDLSVWLDTKFTLTQDLNWFSDKYLLSRNCDIMLMEHHERNCIYEEAEFLKTKIFKGNTKVIRDLNRQVKEYKKEFMPSNLGLYHTGILIRKHNSNTKEFVKHWSKEVRKHSRRDQMSLPYILWKHQGLCKTYIVNFKKTYEMFMNRK